MEETKTDFMNSPLAFLLLLFGGSSSGPGFSTSERGASRDHHI
jgi:hypothetical protein